MIRAATAAIEGEVLVAGLYEGGATPTSLEFAAETLVPETLVPPAINASPTPELVLREYHTRSHSTVAPPYKCAVSQRIGLHGVCECLQICPGLYMAPNHELLCTWCARKAGFEGQGYFITLLGWQKLHGRAGEGAFPAGEQRLSLAQNIVIQADAEVCGSFRVPFPCSFLANWFNSVAVPSFKFSARTKCLVKPHDGDLHLTRTVPAAERNRHDHPI